MYVNDCPRCGGEMEADMFGDLVCVDCQYTDSDIHDPEEPEPEFDEDEIIGY